MATLAQSLVSSSGRRVPLRVRPDLDACRHHYQGEPTWVVKDPLALSYFRFQDEEFFLLKMLDGQISLGELKEQFEAQFPPQKITLQELQQFIGSLHRSGLVISDSPGQGKELKTRRDKNKWRQRWASFANVLSLRFRGIDPDRFLNFTYPFIRWAFSPLAVAAVFLLGISALLLVTVQMDEFYSRLPAFHDFFNLKNAFLLGVTLAVTKVLHEFGHAYFAKHFGGECHEMGVMLLVLTPCLYCNVSDSWMLPNKWHRAAIGAAGMYVELVIASTCTFIWWFTEPGLLNYLALSTMFVCSVSTVVFNGNPLLKYDGYYILADILEIPNLRQKSSQVLQRILAWWCLGIKPPPDPFLPRRKQWLFALYTVAASVYRWIVVLSILWFLYKFFEPYRLEIIGQLLGMASLYGLLIQPVVQLTKFLWVPGRTDQVKKPHLWGTFGVVGAIIAAVCLIPLPHHVICTLEVKPRDASPVYVDVPGTLEEIQVKPGDVVRRGQPLARLSNIDVELAIAELEGQRNQYQAQLVDLERQRHLDRTITLQLAQTQESLAAIEEQLEKKQVEFQRLQLKAPAAGTVLPPQEKPHATDEAQLPDWFGSPMQEKNLGCYLTASVPFCQIGDPKHWQADLVIDQADIEFVRQGQAVEIKLDELPHDRLDGEIEEIAKIDLKVSPRNLSNKAGGELATQTDASGRERPLSTSYQAHVPLDDADGLMRVGLRGRAKIHTRPLTLGSRLWRFVVQTFNFRL